MPHLRGDRGPWTTRTRAVNMCKAWVTRAAAAAHRGPYTGTYKRPPECLMHPPCRMAQGRSVN
eukprot:1760321-Prymnesium_polylepis.1